MLPRVTLALMLMVLASGCATIQATWQALWSPTPDHSGSPELRYVPVSPPESPPAQQQVSVSGELLYVARMVLLDWWPAEKMPTPETDPAARCALSPENYRMDIQERDDIYVVKISFIQQAKCGVIVDADATYEVSREKLEIVSKTPREQTGSNWQVQPDPPLRQEAEDAGVLGP